MTTIAQVRAAIVGVMSGVAGIGRVHGYERYAKREAAFKDLFASGGQIRGWVVRRVATAEDSPAVGRYTITHRWQVRGYMSLDDEAASETAFDDLLEAVRDAFRADETLGGVVASINVGEVAGLQVDDSGPVMFAGVLCHAVRCTLLTRHYE